MGNWMTTYTSTEQVEDPNPIVWINAAKKATTKEDALYKIRRAIYYAKRQDEIGLTLKAKLVSMYLLVKFNLVKILIGIVVLLLILIAILLFRQKNDVKMEVKESNFNTEINNKPIRKQSDVVKFNENKGTKENVKNDQISKIKNIMNYYGYNGDRNELRATSYGNNSNGFLTILGVQLIVVDLQNKRSAIVQDYDNSLIDIKEFKKGTVYFTLIIKDDTRDEDSSSGIWTKGEKHYLPIQVKYTISPDGQVEPGMIKTCYKNDRKYDQYLQEQKNVDLVNLVITEIPALNANYKKSN